MRKFLIAFGLIWTFIWGVFGLFLGMMKHEEWLANMESAARGNDLLQFWQSMHWWKGLSVGHAHALLLSFLMILIAFILPEMKFSENVKKILGYVLVAGVVFASIFGVIGFAPLMGVWYVLVLISVLVSVIGIIQGRRE